MAVSQNKNAKKGTALSGSSDWTPVKSTRSNSNKTRGSKLGKILEVKGAKKKVVPELVNNLIFVAGAVAGHYLQNIIPAEKGTVSDGLTFAGATVVGAMVSDKQQVVKPFVKGIAVGTGAKFVSSAVDGVIAPKNLSGRLERLSGIQRLSGVQRLAKSTTHEAVNNVNYSTGSRSSNSSRNSDF